MASTFDLKEIDADLDRICHDWSKHTDCRGEECMIGFAKISTHECIEKNQDAMPERFEKLPSSDIRGDYDEFDVLHGIAHLLNQCHSCKKDHSESCILNIVRSCYEVIEFGDSQIYEGSPLEYMVKVSGLDAEKASVIREEYTRHREELLNRRAAEQGL
ncbi:MAG: hypothetical protein LKF52_00115 [Butyrivibrio sp.]|jgi:hypothetical protein|nr:hypothetical protein [Butyrivibrio sp.]